ncbi:hypothetical protein, partial [Aeromonas veronii]|uniref:hypothetical protein n=1 Tax=Aeromonas veronii TaxID=654 RepID=UPI00300720F3
ESRTLPGTKLKNPAHRAGFFIACNLLNRLIIVPFYSSPFECLVFPVGFTHKKRSQQRKMVLYFVGDSPCFVQNAAVKPWVIPPKN